MALREPRGFAGSEFRGPPYRSLQAPRVNSGHAPLSMKPFQQSGTDENHMRPYHPHRSRPQRGLLQSLLVVGLAAFALAPAVRGDDDFKGVIGTTGKDSKPNYLPPVRPKQGSPNVVYLLLDDVGFSDLGCYGSEIQTPNIDRLAASGLRCNNFHTRAICSPTRAALLTGRNSHSVGMRTLANLTIGFPSGRGQVTNEAATIAE